DIVLELERGQGPSERVLLALSRYPSTPGSLIFNYDHATGSWKVAGEGDRDDTRATRDRQAILTALAGDEKKLTNDELQEAIGAPRLQWQGQLKKMVNCGEVGRTGKGVKGDPHRFEILRTDSAQSDAQKKVRTNAAQVPAHNRAECDSTAASFSAAHHVVMQQKEADA